MKKKKVFFLRFQPRFCVLSVHALIVKQTVGIIAFITGTEIPSYAISCLLFH